jgi:hypothetical protein
MHEQARADKEYLRILHLAASTSEADVEAALSLLLDGKSVPTFEATRDLVRVPSPPIVPLLSAPLLDLRVYDDLLPSRCEHDESSSRTGGHVANAQSEPHGHDF